MQVHKWNETIINQWLARLHADQRPEMPGTRDRVQSVAICAGGWELTGRNGAVSLVTSGYVANAGWQVAGKVVAK